MDMFYVLKNIMGQNVVKLWDKDTNLQEVDFIILPCILAFDHPLLVSILIGRPSLVFTRTLA